MLIKKSGEGWKVSYCEAGRGREEWRAALGVGGEENLIQPVPSQWQGPGRALVRREQNYGQTASYAVRWLDDSRKLLAIRLGSCVNIQNPADLRGSSHTLTAANGPVLKLRYRLDHMRRALALRFAHHQTARLAHARTLPLQPSESSDEDQRRATRAVLGPASSVVIRH